MPPAAPWSLRERGSILIESLIAVFLISIALLMGLPLLFEQPRIVRRLDAQRHALTALDSTLEALRAGTLPLQPARYGTGTSDDPAVWVDVEPQPDPPGLYRVSLRAVYRIRDRTYERKVETLFWRPPLP
jgi:type II secretory pathway pseudopilin PulG